MAHDWLLIKDGAAHEAGRRLDATNQMAYAAANQFWRDARTATDGLEAPSSEGLGLEMFKALTDVLMVAFPEELIIEKVAGEALKAFRDVAIAGVSQQRAATAAETKAHAQDQLRHVLDDLLAGFEAGLKAGKLAAMHKVDDSIQKFFGAHPEYQNFDFGNDTTQWEAWVCDQIGIRDEGVMDPSATITEHLWAQFNHEIARVSWGMKMEHTPVLERQNFDFAQWHALDAHDRLERLAHLDQHARQQLLQGYEGDDTLSQDQIAQWLKLAEEWGDPMSRPVAEAEAVMLVMQGG